MYNDPKIATCCKASFPGCSTEWRLFRWFDKRSWWFSRGRRGHFNSWRWPHHLAILKHNRSTDDIILQVNYKLFLAPLTKWQQVFGQVVGVECTGLSWETTGKIGVSNNLSFKKQNVSLSESLVPSTAVINGRGFTCHIQSCVFKVLSYIYTWSGDQHRERGRAKERERESLPIFYCIAFFCSFPLTQNLEHAAPMPKNGSWACNNNLYSCLHQACFLNP